MENYNYQSSQQSDMPYVPQMSLPNATAVLVLGILSIVMCWCYGVFGIVLGIIALVMAVKSEKTYKTSPMNYTVSSLNNVKAGKICAIIGLSLSVLYLIFIVIAFAFSFATSAYPFMFGNF